MFRYRAEFSRMIKCYKLLLHSELDLFNEIDLLYGCEKGIKKVNTLIIQSDYNMYVF